MLNGHFFYHAFRPAANGNPATGDLARSVAILVQLADSGQTCTETRITAVLSLFGHQFAAVSAPARRLASLADHQG
jgi:hypothetical protein